MLKILNKPNIQKTSRKGKNYNRIKRSRPRLRLPELPVSITGRIWLYPPLLIASLIFAQALKMPISYMIFVFVIIMPLGSALQLVLAAAYIHTSARSESDTVEKRSPVSFSVITSNECIFPFPFVEAELLVPDERGAKCVPKRAGFSLTPLSGCEIDYTAAFAFRGLYSVGLKQLWVYDFFRIVKLRLRRDDYADIFVLPRRYELPPKPLSSESDLNTQSVMHFHGTDNTELSDIRSYIRGDSLKSIHWKLSSKSQELIVKDYSRNTGNSVCILCDLEPYYARAAELQNPIEPVPLPEYDDIIDNLNSDLVIEHCLAAALRELRVSNIVTLMWLSEEDGSITPNTRVITNLAEFNTVFREFAAAPLVDHEGQLRLLSSLINDEEASLLVYVTPRLDTASAGEYISLASERCKLGANSVELIICSDTGLYTPNDDYSISSRELISELGAHMEVNTD